MIDLYNIEVEGVDVPANKNPSKKKGFERYCYERKKVCKRVGFKILDKVNGLQSFLISFPSETGH